MEQHDIALLEPRLGALIDEILRRHALQHDGGGLFVGHALGHMHELVDAHQALLAVGAQHAAIGDAVTLLETFHLRPDLDDHAGRLAPDGVGQRRLVEAGASIDVDEVETDRGVPDLHLAGAGRTDLDVVNLHLLRSAILVH